MVPAAATRRPAPGPPAVERRDRRLVSYVLFVPLAAIALYYVTGANAFGQLGRLATALVLLALAPSFWRRLGREPLWSVFTFTLVLFGSWLVQPLVELVVGSPAAAFRGFRWTLYTALWCAPLWILTLTIHTLDDLRRAVRLVDGLGLAIAGSVYLAAAAYSSGYHLGDVVDTGEVARVFGPLGDMVTFCLLLFLLRELARRGWGRFVFYLVPLLLGRTRGALVALGVGLAAYGLTQLPRALRRGRTGELFLHGLTWLAALLLVAGVLQYTAPGRRALERFGDLETLVEGQALGGRLDSIAHGLAVFAAHPLLGVGPGGYQERVIAQDLGWSHEDRPGAGALKNRFALSTSAENQLAQLAAETGVLGLATFLAWCVLVLRTARRATRVADPAVREFMVGGQLFVVTVLVGIQSTTYLADKSSIALLLCVVVALAERACQAPAERGAAEGRAGGPLGRRGWRVAPAPRRLAAAVAGSPSCGLGAP